MAQSKQYPIVIYLTPDEAEQLRMQLEVDLREFWNYNDGNDEGDRRAYANLNHTLMILQAV